MTDTPYLDSIQDAAMSDQQKATEIRDRLIKWAGILIENSHHVDLVMRINGKDVRYECDWVKELLK